ncbi:MAG: gliding motility-associated ABC transporter permease subunit GldF [Bacteroidota bacterium]
MWALIKKELQAFFGSTLGYLVMLLFLVLVGLFLWVFKQGFNIFEQGFANLVPFFDLVPWIFLFLIPAITMRSFSEEKRTGTLELLLLKPLSLTEIVTGKLLAAFLLGLFTLLPTLTYILAVSSLGTTIGNLDMGLVSGAYFGLCFLLLVYVAIGIFSSSISDNQIIAFLIGASLSFMVYYGPEAAATLFSSGSLQEQIIGIGAKAHFENIAKGILTVPDLIYFLSLAVFFVVLTTLTLNSSKTAS